MRRQQTIQDATATLISNQTSRLDSIARRTIEQKTDQERISAQMTDNLLLQQQHIANLDSQLKIDNKARTALQILFTKQDQNIQSLISDTRERNAVDEKERKNLTRSLTNLDRRVAKSNDADARRDQLLQEIKDTSGVNELREEMKRGIAGIGGLLI